MGVAVQGRGCNVVGFRALCQKVGESRPNNLGIILLHHCHGFPERLEKGKVLPL
jgi:hypothetical protein